MGEGFTYYCKKCHHSYSVMLGIGMLFPFEYEEEVGKITDGVYGDEWRDLFQKTPNAAIDAGKVLYICDNCRRWEIGTDITIYLPKDPDADWGIVPYVVKSDLKSDYRVLKRHYHVCNTCKKRMHKATFEEMMELYCPKCGEKNMAQDLVDWD